MSCYCQEISPVFCLFNNWVTRQRIYYDNYPCKQLTKNRNRTTTKPFLLADFNLWRWESAPLDTCVHKRFVYIYRQHLHIQVLILHLGLPYSNFRACQLTLLSSKGTFLKSQNEYYICRKFGLNESQELQNKL